MSTVPPAATEKIAPLSDSTNNSKKRSSSTTDGNGDEISKKEKATTPYDAYFAKFKKFQKDHDFLGAMLIKGIQSTGNGDDDDGDDEQQEQDNSKYTTEEMEGLRFVLINQSRSDELEEMASLVLGEQAGESVMMFNTSYSYQVMDSWEVVKKIVNSRSKTMTLPKKIDILFAYTHTLTEHDVWMHDNEGDMGTLVKGLGAAWKRLLSKNSDEELGLDSEYSKPGVLELLSQFRKAIDGCDSCYEMGKFKYV